MNRLQMFVTFALLASLSVPMLSQDERPMRGPAGERVEQLKKLRMQEALALNEETSIRFFARYNDHQEELRSAGKKRAEAIDDLQVLLKKNASDSEIDAKLKAVVTAEREVIDLRQKFVERLGDILTKHQIARYVVFERNFNQDLRDFMRESAQQRWRNRN
jgi:hypothetical protein